MPQSSKKVPTVYPKNWTDYQLLDCGDNRKLEYFGNVLCDRPEPSAYWNKMIAAKKWEEASLIFQEKKGQTGQWKIKKDPPVNWKMEYPMPHKNLYFHLEKTGFKHIGIFPEQAVNWDYIYKHCQRILANGKVPKVLNLFAYTGAASIVAKSAGAEVTHVDSIKQVVNWANKNAQLNNEKDIRWIVEDAQKFVKRALKKGEKYNGIILDPPSFGHGPNTTKWKLDKDLAGMLEMTVKLLDRKDSFFVLNTYSPQLKMEDLQLLLKQLPGFPKSYESKILGIKCKSEKFLPLGNLVRFYS